MAGVRFRVVALAVAGGLLLSGAGQAAAVGPGPSTDFARLLADVGALGPGSSLLAKAQAAAAAAGRGQPCTAANILMALRNEASAQKEKKLSVAQAGLIEADALQVDAMLLTQPGSQACGGAAAAPGAGDGPAVRLVSSDTQGFEVMLTLPAAHFVSRLGGGRGFTDMSMAGMGNRERVGAPNVPAFTGFFAVPLGATVAANLMSASSYVLNNVDLWPSQDEPVDADPSPFGDKPFTIDAKLYATDAFYPAAPDGSRLLGMLRDLRLGGLEADGAQYNAVSRTLRVFTALDLKVTFGGQNSRVFGDNRTTSVWNLPAQVLYRNSLVNYATVVGNLAAARFLFCGEELLVVTTTGLHPAAETLATARRADGISTRIVDLGAGAGQIGTTKEQIQTFIRGELSSSCLIRPSYVLLLGSSSLVPTWLVTVPGYSGGFDGMIASDLPYSLADDSDIFADLALGRLPARNLAEANTIVAKVVGYEDSPPVSFSFYSHATFTSYFQGSDSTDDRGFTKTSELIRDALLAQSYSVDRVYTDDSNSVNPQFYYDGTPIPSALLKPGFAWNGTGGDALADWNAGRSIVFHRDHGAPDGWGHPDFTDGSVVSPNYVTQLTNGAFLPVVFSINCASAKFDSASPSFVEQLLQRSGGGAVGAIGDSRNSPSFTNNHMVIGLFDAIFPNVVGTYGSSTPIRRMGDVLVAGKAYMATQVGLDGQNATQTLAEHYLYHWFGDPTMQIWTATPLKFIVAKAFVIILDDGSVRIQLDQSAADGAVVTLEQDGAPLGRALLAAGQATIQPEAAVSPNARLTLSLDKTGFQGALLPAVQLPPPPS